MTSRRFCPKCGTPIDKGTFCADCTEHHLRYKTPLIQVSEYNRTCDNESWRYFTDIEELVKTRIRQALGDKNATVELEPFEFTPRKKEKKRLTATVTTKGHEHTVDAILAYRQCDYGEKKNSTYFEGILQLRNVDETMMPFIHKRLEELSNKGIFLTKTSEQADGVDLYLTDKNAVQQLARQVQQHYGGELKISPQLFSHDHERSKDIYRVNAYVKLPEYKKGDVISYAKPKSPQNKKYLKVTKMGKVIFGTNLFSGKQESFQPGYVQDITKLDKNESTILRTHPNLTVLDPTDYQEDDVRNTDAIQGQFDVDDTVTIVASDEGILIVE